MDAIPATPEDLLEIRQNLDPFLRQFDDCIPTRPSRKHLHTYVRGQTSSLERKSIEPMALEHGVAPRTLQEFLSLHRWDHEAVRRRVQELVLRQHGDENAIGVIDETGMAKKGDKTAGVSHQYCNSKGKQDNCVVTVHLSYVTDTFNTLVDADLFLPECWDQDRQRCTAAGIPPDVVYRPKWQIGLELIDRTMAQGLRYKFITGDELYGRARGFRDGLAHRGLLFVVEIPRNLRGWTQRPRTFIGKKGRLRLAKGEPKARRVEHLWLRGGPSWTPYHIKDTEKGPVVWKARVTRLFPSSGNVPQAECWLVVAEHVLSGETKYFYSNAPRDTPVETLLKVAFSRSPIEQDFHDIKGEVGFDHFEVRHYKPLQRHLVLSMVSLLFLMQQERRLKKKKSLVERGASPPSCRSAA